MLCICGSAVLAPGGLWIGTSSLSDGSPDPVCKSTNQTLTNEKPFEISTCKDSLVAWEGILYELASSFGWAQVLPWICVQKAFCLRIVYFFGSSAMETSGEVPPSWSLRCSETQSRSIRVLTGWFLLVMITASFDCLICGALVSSSDVIPDKPPFCF